MLLVNKKVGNSSFPGMVLKFTIGFSILDMLYTVLSPIYSMLYGYLKNRHADGLKGRLKLQ